MDEATTPPRALEPWRAVYWERPLARTRCAAMADKYAALAALEAQPPGPAQDAALREAARRWPGCLRESQLAGPDRCRERREHALAGASGPELPRADWQARGAVALVLWADLHPLLADQLRWRRTLGPADGGDVAAFLRHVAAGDAAARWPADAALLTRIGGPRVRPRLAYAWLAAQAGLDLPRLNFALFGRTGPWDARPGDPDPRRT